MSFEEFRECVQANFNFPICLDRPYKICDFKPAYGEILKQYLTEYDFWGYCDCDLIFGDLRAFLTENILNNYLKIFTRGHLSLYHNDKETNSFYKTQKLIDYKRVLQSPKVHAFDEWGRISRCWDEMKLPYYDKLCMDDIIHTLDGFHPTKQISGYGSPYHCTNVDVSCEYKRMKHITYLYSKGKLERIWIEGKGFKREEVIYVHLQKRDMDLDVKMNSTEFMIVPDKFTSVKELEENLISKISPDRMTRRNVVEYLKQMARNLIR